MRGALSCRNVALGYSSPLSPNPIVRPQKTNLPRGHEGQRSQPLDGGCSWHSFGTCSWLSLLSCVFKVPAPEGPGSEVFGDLFSLGIHK